MAREALPLVRELEGSLGHPGLRQEFRKFLRENPRMDNNKSQDPATKMKMEVWLELLLHCQQLFSLPESEEQRRKSLMAEVGTVFLAKDGHNVALPGAQARRELVAHCSAVAREEVTPDLELLRRAAWNFVWGKVEQKHDVWRAARGQATTLAQLCALL